MSSRTTRRVPRISALAIALAVAPACTGSLDAPSMPRPSEVTPGGPASASGAGSAGGGAGIPLDPSAPIASNDPEIVRACLEGELLVGSAPLRRLSNREYLATLEELFPSLHIELPELPPDATANGFENDARSLAASDVHVARWAEIAFRYTSALTESNAKLAERLPCASSLKDDAATRACGERFVREFGLETHRRPLSAEEVGRYSAYLETQRKEIDFLAGIQLTAIAMLQSPWFLYRFELPDPARAAEGHAALSPLELASRLSFFLWERMPDAALFESALADELASSEQIAAQARRMLADPRARVSVGDFHRQWLDFDRIMADEHAQRTPEVAATWSASIQSAAHEELSRFVTRTIFDGEGTLAALLLSRETELNRELAAIYGVKGPSDGWAAVSLPAAQRAGLLTRVGVLAARAHPGNGSPPLRGVYIMEHLLCEQPPAPPPNANITTPEQPADGSPRTNRQLFEERTEPALCRGCHVRIDGFGFGLEHYDAAGAWRDLDHGLPVDASSALVGTDVDGEYEGAIELSERLAQSERVASCAVNRWYRYAVGRGVEAQDECALARLKQRFGDNGGQVLDLMTAIVTNPEFRYRPVEQE